MNPSKFNVKATCVVFFSLLCILLSQPLFLLGNTSKSAPDKVFYVDINASGAGTGLTWADAFTDVQDGIDEAYTYVQSNSSETVHVWIAKGRYIPTSHNPKGGGDVARNYTFVMKNSVHVYGGFSGDETSVDERANYWIGQPNETILSGDLSNDDIYTGWTNTTTAMDVNMTENVYNVVYYYNVSDETTLDGVTISGGNADTKVTGKPYHDGGGAHLTNDMAILQNCRIHYNRAVNAGGAITFNGGRLVDCVIKNNRSTGLGSPYYDNGDGAGVKLHNGGMLINSIVTHNVAYKVGTTSLPRGGGVCVSNNVNDHYIINCVIANNYTNGYGGGIGSYNASSRPHIYNSVIWNNEDEVGDEFDDIKSDPGASTSTSFTIENCAISGDYTTGTLPSRTSYNTSNLIVLSTTNTDPTGPKFYNPDDGDWRVQDGSPCINSGDNSFVSGGIASVGTISYDFSGNERIMESTVDIGAYENVYVAPAPQILPDGNGRFYVKAGASGTGDASSWENASSWLQGVIDAAAEWKDDNEWYDVEIWIAEGTYYPTARLSGYEDDPRGYSFLLKDEVKLYGGFPEDATTSTCSSIETRDFYHNKTILSGDIGAPGIATDNAYHVVYWPGETPNDKILDGLVISGGYADHATSDLEQRGGGILINAADYDNVTYQNHGDRPTNGVIRNCVLTDNYAVYGGGIATYVNDVEQIGFTIPYPQMLVDFINIKFTGNSADKGGAVHTYNYEEESNPTFSGCLFSGNYATNGGAGIYLYAYHPQPSTIKVINCTFAANKTVSGAPAVLLDSDPDGSIETIWFINSIIYNNYSDNSPDLQVEYTHSSPRYYASSIEYCFDEEGVWNTSLGYQGSSQDNVDADPLFPDVPLQSDVPTDEGDFHLGAGSGCIGLGTADSSIPEYDLDGIVMLEPWDAGAYVYVPSAGSIYNSVTTGTWGTGSSWDHGSEPPSDADVYIHDGHTITVTANVSAANLYFAGAAHIIIQDGASLTISEGFFNGNGDISCSGSGALIIDGVIYDLNGNARINLNSGRLRFRSAIHVQQSEIAPD